MSDSGFPERRCRLYLITPPRLELLDFRDQLAQALDAGDVACVQLRLKDNDQPADPDQVRRAIDVLRPLAHERDVAFILNDDPELARATGCDGVHIGKDDMDYGRARKILGPDSIIGVSCYHSRHRAMEAGEAGADYVAFGAFFPTATKIPPETAEIGILSWWQELMELPCVAIGGIKVDNCATLVRAGADFLAVVSGVWDHPEGAAAAVQAFNRVIDENS